ncbi:hypothetical protein D1007_11522 [Hordeum vulgare]|nr:hypothetical protein D1007_11522 [Hordeum vulgare]
MGNLSVEKGEVGAVPIDGIERNRASPQAICELYKHINEDQRAAIREMGTGLFLDIKCGYLHKTVVTWFTRLYQPGRRGFVVHRRGFIPLTEESVHKILGIPRGDIDVKYEADYDNEDEIVSCLFPGVSSRPKITTVASKIMNNNNADATFKKLWLIYIVSTVLAPTTDTRISNNCYPMLEHINQANRLNLCKFVVDQLHEHLSKGKYTKGCLLYYMFDTKSPSGATSQLNLPSDSDVCSLENNSPTHTLVNSHELEQKIRGSAAGLANRLCELKSTRTANTERDSEITHEEIKLIVEKELGLLKETCTEHFEERNVHKDLTKINARPIKQMPRRKHAESTQEDGEKELEYVQQLGVAIKRKTTAKLKQPSPKRRATRRSPRLARISPSNATGADVSHAQMEQTSSGSSGNKGPGVETGPQMFQYPMSEKLTAFLATRDQDEMDADLAEELDDYESHLVDFFKQKRAAEATAIAARSNDMAGDAGVQSVTPKPNPHKGRVKKPSRFQLSPYDDEIKVSNEEEDVYAKLMLSSKFKRNGNSTIKNVIIIKYEKSWAYTWDLADSSYITRELSANCAEVGIEYVQETNKVEGKLILSHFVAKFLLQGEHAKKIVTNIFERKKDFSLSCQNLIMFPVIEEIGANIVSANHWYVLCINNTAQRFETLDSLRGKTNMGLICHATAVMKRIKEAWKLYYYKSRVQIENYELEIIDVPKQAPK